MPDSVTPQDIKDLQDLLNKADSVANRLNILEARLGGKLAEIEAGFNRLQDLLQVLDEHTTVKRFNGYLLEMAQLSGRIRDIELWREDLRKAIRDPLGD